MQLFNIKTLPACDKALSRDKEGIVQLLSQTM